MTPELSERYKEFVQSRVKNPNLIFQNSSIHHMALLHPAIGISGEAGEIIDTVKKCVIYGKDLDYANIHEEIGDLMFYIQDLLTVCGFTLEEVIEANIAKLSDRYKEGYSDEEAALRRDKILDDQINSQLQFEFDKVKNSGEI